MNTLTVAVPWNGRHYIPSGGCHPLYRGLVDPLPDGVNINAWDHVAVQARMAGSARTCQLLMAQLAEHEAHPRGPLAGGWTAEDQLLTQLLPGDIELFHSVPFPSLTRPFWLHLETLHSLFSPWLQAGTPLEAQAPVIRDYYRQLLSGPWCLGVSSHLPHTLQALSEFLDHADIPSHWVSTSIGLPGVPFTGASGRGEKPPLNSPRYLFAVSAAPTADFFTCGGHRVLRAWKALCAARQPGILIMACERPSVEALAAAGVDNDFVEEQTGRSIAWTYASRTELDALMAGSHVFLQPADVLCTFDILRAMSLGCVPVIAAIQGSDQLLQDNLHGLVVGTVPLVIEPWLRPIRSAQDEAQISEELLRRIPTLVTAPAYRAVQHAALHRATTELNGDVFARTVWAQIRQRYADTPHANHLATAGPLRHSLLTTEGLRRAFTGDAHVRLRIYNGLYSVWSQGGYYVMVKGRPDVTALHLSLLRQYAPEPAESLVFAHSLQHLKGQYLPQPAHAESVTVLPPSGMVQRLSQLLMPFPRVHSYCSHWLRRYRHMRSRLIKAIKGNRAAERPPTEREEPHDAL